METETIRLKIDADLARAYQEATVKDKSKLQLLMNRWLRELFARSKSLKSLMNDYRPTLEHSWVSLWATIPISAIFYDRVKPFCN